MEMIQPTPSAAPARRTGLKRKAPAPLKRVQFSVATEYIFQVGCAATGIPHDSVPGVGLEGPAIRVETTPITDKRSQLMMYTHRDRVCLLRRAGYSVADLNQQSRDLQAIQKSRMETVNEFIKERREAIALQARTQMDLARLLS